jgi:hypothetical protein
MQIRLLVAIFAFAGLVSADDHRDWKHGTVRNISGSGVSRNGHQVITYRIDGAKGKLAGQEIVRRQASGVTVNNPVEYDVSEGKLYIKDSHGKTHKLRMLATE